MRDWLKVAAGVRPGHPYLVYRGRPLSYIEADETADRIAGGLRDLTNSARIGIWAENRPETVLAVFGAWRAGATAVLINRRLRPAEIQSMLERTGIEVVVGSDVPELGPTNVDPAQLEGPPPTHPDLDRDADAWLVSTSGSSGAPKWVRLTFGNLEASAASSAAVIDHRPGDVWLADLPLFHVGGAMITVRTARQGATALLEDSFDPVRVASLLESGDAGIYSFVATTLHATLDALRPGAPISPSVKAALLGGGPISRDLHQRALQRGLPALRTYGMTETASQIATERSPGAGMTAVDGAELRIRHDRVEVRGPMVSPGYLDESARPADGWFTTGDLGEIDPIGRLTVTGRADLVIITGGENVSPEEVEGALLSHEGVTAAAVVGVPDTRWGQAVGAMYQGTAAPGELERHLRYRLAGFKIPKVWLHVDEIPRRGIGKPDRAAVTALLSGLTPGPDAADHA